MDQFRERITGDIGLGGSNSMIFLEIPRKVGGSLSQGQSNLSNSSHDLDLADLKKILYLIKKLSSVKFTSFGADPAVRHAA